MDKPLVWLEGEVKSPPFSRSARIEAGFLLRRLQRGEELAMPHLRPMPTIGRRCCELRIKDQDHEWRMVCRVDSDAIVIVAVFAKKERRTSRGIIEVCRNRLRGYDAAGG